ncbi:hypothetical protein I6F11_09330 [Ensifer sp. NBAIM29]|nr:hypothetical protein [Ensifer sp. NBAIM29]
MHNDATELKVQASNLDGILGCSLTIQQRDRLHLKGSEKLQVEDPKLNDALGAEKGIQLQLSFMQH